MRFVRRLTGWAFGAAGAVGLLLCLAGLAGCWALHAGVAGRVDRVFGRADAALADIGGNLGRAGDRLRRAGAELEAFRQREAGPAAQPPAERGARRALSRKAVEAVGPQAAEARELLGKATEAALVANGLLDALAELPVVERVSVDTDRLKETAAQLADVSERTARLASRLGPAAPAGDDADIGAESSGAAAALRQAIDLVAAGADGVGRGRETVAAGRDRVMRWVNGLAAAITAVLVWVGAGQLSLLAHGRGLIRRRRPAVPEGQRAGANENGIQ
jgi:hypothetical protein